MSDKKQVCQICEIDGKTVGISFYEHVGMLVCDQCHFWVCNGFIYNRETGEFEKPAIETKGLQS